MSSRRYLGPLPGQMTTNSRPMAPQRPMPTQQPPQRQYIQQPALPPQAMGDAGYAGNGPVMPADLRRALDGVERRMGEQLASLKGDVDSRIDQVLQYNPNPGLRGVNGIGDHDSVMNGLGQDVRAAITQGKCNFYSLNTTIAFDAGERGVKRFGGVILTNEGPFFMTKLIAYAQIDDPNASNFPFSLLNAPSCDQQTPSSANCDVAATAFSANCSTIIPTIDADGMFIPISPRNCKLICCGTETCCFTETCPDGTTKTFSGKVPITMLDHPECVDGITDINLNGCMFENIPFPLAVWEDAMFDINDSPDCVGVCGFLDCQKQLDISLTLTRALRYNVVVQFVILGFRVFTCT